MRNDGQRDDRRCYLDFFRGIPPVAAPTLWITWFIGNLLGCLVVTPLLLTWAYDFPHHWNLARKVEALIFLALLVIVSLYVFVNPSGAGALHQALIYLIFPFAIWAALRLEQVGASSTVFIVSGIAIWGTIHEVGPFADIPVNESLILLQTFTGVLALMSLTLAASASEQRRAEDTLRNQVDELASLNDASRIFLENTERQTLADAICRLAVARFGLLAVWINPLPVEEKLSDPLAAYPTHLQSDGQLAKLHSQIPNLRQRLLEAERTGYSGVFHSPSSFPQVIEGNPSGKPLSSFAFFPLLYGKEQAGILIVASNEPGSFSKEQMLLLQSYANLAAIAIQNSWLFDQVRMGNEQLHALSHRLMEVQELERIHLSRELHDEFGQALAGMMMNLGLLERDAEWPDLVRSHAAELKRIASEVLEDLHSLAVKLRPASLDHLGLVTALQQYIQEFNRQYHLDVQFETVGIDETRLPVEVEFRSVPDRAGVTHQRGAARSCDSGGCAFEPPQWNRSAYGGG